jgi:hypothetical protein
MTLSFRFAVYLLPFLLWLFEYVMRTVMNNPEVNDFFPSSCAAGALGLIVPLLASKRIPPPAGTVIPAGFMYVAEKDENVRKGAMAILFLGVPAWLWTVYLSIGGKWPASWTWGSALDQKFWIGFILYLLAVGLNEAKESV